MDKFEVTERELNVLHIKKHKQPKNEFKSNKVAAYCKNRICLRSRISYLLLRASRILISGTRKAIFK